MLNTCLPNQTTHNTQIIKQASPTETPRLLPPQNQIQNPHTLPIKQQQILSNHQFLLSQLLFAFLSLAMR